MKHFKIEEFDCSHTGKNLMDGNFLASLDLLREHVGFPMVVTSGYRDKTHPVEAVKQNPGTGTHCLGIAADIKITNSSDRFVLIDAAMMDGFTGIGIAKDFIHLDMRESDEVMWVY
jgi:zinc D-Ala-D-Ala carboxypeptidase